VAMKALIIDDSITHIKQMEKMLAKLGFEVAGFAQSGSAGIKLFKELSPDVVFLDIIMPEMNGHSVLRMVRSMDSKVPILVLSTLGADATEAGKALELGACGVLSKPVMLRDIYLALKRIFGDLKEP
jgi:CheY-like chemotaxis protein